MSAPAAFAEHRLAIFDSWRLTKGQFWKLAGAYILAICGIIAMSLLVLVIFAAAVAIANRIAPEHLELALEDPEPWADKIRHAGAIFLGHWSVEAIGDYCAGPNHVLPTMRSARFSSPLGVYDFQKRTSLVAVSRAGAQKLAPIAATLAQGEGLMAHARSAQMRILP